MISAGSTTGWWTPPRQSQVVLAGRPFMVLTYRAIDLSSWVSFLIDGRIERGWVGDWVIDNSEALHEAR